MFAADAWGLAVTADDHRADLSAWSHLSRSISQMLR
jgi:hypothetical protein